MSELSGLQIFKYLPASKKGEHTNCKACGFPTCMAFALNLAKQKTEISKCPHCPDELKKLYEQNNRQPQKTVDINGLKIGGETVLYRHEKTFNNKCGLAVVIDCQNSDWKNKINEIENFKVKKINEILKIDLLILKNSKQEDVENCSKSLNTITFEEFNKLPLKIIIDNDFQKTKDELINIRKKAVLEKDENYSSPVCVYLSHTEDLDFLCAKTSYYICKYANMLVFEDFNENLFTALMTLRQNIYTDPQKPLKVESKIYEFNNPDENSLIFMTTNFALTFFAVANELENLQIPSYLIVTESDGMSVLTAWSAEKFTAKTAAKTVEKFGLINKVKNRKIIIPGLLAHMKEELEEEIKDFEIIVGTINAFEISDFVKNLENNSK